MKHYPFIVSACLAGKYCKYNAGSNPCDAVIQLVKAKLAFPVCPETLSGLKKPREPAEQINDKIFSRTGEDLTSYFVLGTQRAYNLALKTGATKAVLKARSPSCGYGKIYSGKFDGTLVTGDGLFTKMLIKKGFKIFTEENLPDLQKCLEAVSAEVKTASKHC